MPSSAPGHSRGQGRGGSTKLFAVASFSRSRCGAPLRPTPFRASRMRTPRGPSRTLKSLHRIVSTSDVPCRHPQAHPSRNPSPPDMLSVVTLLAEGGAELNLRARGPSLRPADEARRASARERLSSYREPASRDPQAMHTELSRDPRTRAPFRLLSIRAPRQAVLRIFSWLAPSVTNEPCDLSVKKTRDVSNRRLPPKRTACTRTSCVPGSLSPLSQRGRPMETKAPCGMTGGPDVSRRPKTASADRHATRNLVLYCLTAWRRERGRFLPTALMRSSL